MKERFIYNIIAKRNISFFTGLTYAPDPVQPASAASTAAGLTFVLSPPLPPKSCLTTSLVRNLTSDLAELENLTASGSQQQEESSLPPQAPHSGRKIAKQSFFQIFHSFAIVFRPATHSFMQPQRYSNVNYCVTHRIQLPILIRTTNFQKPFLTKLEQVLQFLKFSNVSFTQNQSDWLRNTVNSGFVVSAFVTSCEKNIHSSSYELLTTWFHEYPISKIPRETMP